MKKSRGIDPAVRGYLLRRYEALEEIIDSVRVFSKKYNAAVDDLEEIEALLEACSSRSG
jgi:hypothetical protein